MSIAFPSLAARTAGLASLVLLGVPALGTAQTYASRIVSDEPSFDPAAVTFTKDIAPILQENCQRCHRDGGVAPMSLVTYQEARRWAARMKDRTGRRDRMGAMPPYYVERGIGIQHYKDDERLTDEEVAKIAAWVDHGTPEGDPADMPPPKVWPEVGVWTLGEPDLVVRSQTFSKEAGSPDWWGDMASIPIPSTEDRYVRAVAIREINDVDALGGGVGGRFIVHHVIWATRGPDGQVDGGWPVHELGRNPDIFDPKAGRLLPAGSEIVSESVHLNAAAEDATAYLEFGFYFHPPDYQPAYRRASSVGFGLGDAMNIDIQPNQDGQTLHAFQVLPEHMKIASFEPHLHAPGYRMCLEAIWGNLIETLTCTGYDHNWVKQYTYDDDYAPLLPKGTILHIVAWMDNTENNPNIPDPRNWQGSGNRSVANMFIDLGKRVLLTDEQFVEEMARRRQALGVGPNDHIVGCPLCMANIPPFDSDDVADTGSSTSAPGAAQASARD
ncbi:MAG TPA: cytochrome c [Longimicrobiales bacterium]|nr:cytochrome c [Longimicrobiales bacterium]